MTFENYGKIWHIVHVIPYEVINHVMLVEVFGKIINQQFNAEHLLSYIS